MHTVVALIGRPNVGKSTLFNRMIRGGRRHPKQTAIIEETPGVTRDRNYGTAEWEGRSFTVVDTGGFFAGEGVPDEGEIARQVREQAYVAIDEADVIVHVLDGKEGLTHADAELVGFLRKSGKPLLWAVNKIDSPKQSDRVIEFYRIGADEMVPVSAISGLGFDDFLDALLRLLPVAEARGEAAETDGIPHVAVVGRPNVGKSTLINCLLGKKRHIVSPAPGTTRDAIDSVCTYYGKRYLFIDTAGLRRKVISGSIESFSVIRAIKSVERADVVLIVLDASAGIVDQDQRIAGLVEEYGKGAILLLNKWDLVKEPENAYKQLRQELKLKMWFMEHVPRITTSGLVKRRVTTVFPLIDEIMGERKKNLSTAELNRFLARVSSAQLFPSFKGRELKWYYVTQVGTEPPAFRIVVNHPSAFGEAHRRYFEKAFRAEYSFKGTPIRIYFKSR